MPSSKTALWLFAVLSSALLLSGCALPPEQLALRQRLEAGVQTPEDMVRFKTSDAAYAPVISSGQDWPQVGAATASSASAAALLQAAQLGDANAVRRLLREGASVEGRGGAMTPLAAAAMAGHTDVVKLLLAKGARTDTSNEDGESALMRAVRLNHVATAAVLLDAGASREVRNRQGDGLVMVAITEDFSAMLSLLLSKGANPNTPDRDGLTPLYWTDYLQRGELTQLLLNAGANPAVKKVVVPVNSGYAMGAF